MSKSGKGSSYEREICKMLSLWWSTGVGIGPTDDLFWRSSQSGGRATQRAKSGKKTFGSYGDIAFVNPAGAPLLEFFTIELKRGYSDCSAGDLLDAAPTAKVRMFEAFLAQAIGSHKAAGSKHWMLIHKRDRRLAVVYLSWEAWVDLMAHGAIPRAPMIRFNLKVNRGGGEASKLIFFGIPLTQFLKLVTPKTIQTALNLAVK